MSVRIRVPRRVGFWVLMVPGGVAAFVIGSRVARGGNRRAGLAITLAPVALALAVIGVVQHSQYREHRQESQSYAMVTRLLEGVPTSFSQPAKSHQVCWSRDTSPGKPGAVAFGPIEGPLADSVAVLRANLAREGFRTVRGPEALTAAEPTEFVAERADPLSSVWIRFDRASEDSSGGALVVRVIWDCPGPHG